MKILSTFVVLLVALSLTADALTTDCSDFTSGLCFKIYQPVCVSIGGQRNEHSNLCVACSNHPDGFSYLSGKC